MADSNGKGPHGLYVAVADRFDVLQLRSGPVLRPRGVAAYHAVEFADDKSRAVVPRANVEMIERK